MEKTNRRKMLYMGAIPAVIVIFYIPMFLSKIYISSDEFSSIAAPAILSGHDWTPTITYHSYHGLGYTIFLTPIFAMINEGVVAHKILLITALLVKILLGEMLFFLFQNHFCVDKSAAFFLSIAYVCGVFGGDEYGLSALSELPFAFCLMVGIFAWIKYQKKRRLIDWFVFTLPIAYIYLIHARCLILYIALLVVGAIYMIRERTSYKGLLKRVAILLFVIAMAYLLLNIVQRRIYVVAGGEELVNDPGMVLSASSYQFRKLLQVGNIIKIIQICFCLIATQCMVSLGVGSVALACCVYIIYAELSGREKVDKNIFYLSILSILCIVGMNFAIGIQSLGRVVSGNYSWLTYIRYAEPFWILPYIVFVYMFQRSLPRGLKYALWIGMILVGTVINLFLAPILSKGYGLTWSILNRLFYNPQMDVGVYFTVFVKILYIVIIVLIISWNDKRYKNRVAILLALGLLTVNFQYEKYYIQKAETEYEEVDKSAELIERLAQFDSTIMINVDADSIVYSSKLQFLAFDTTLYYTVDKNNFPDDAVLFSDVGDYLFDNSGVQMIQLDEGEYVYISGDYLYTLIKEETN